MTKTASKYWQLVRFDAAGQRRVEELASVQTFFEVEIGDMSGVAAHSSHSDSAIQAQLWAMIQGERLGSQDAQGESKHHLANLCLRCCISHLIEQVCGQLAQQFGEYHGFTRIDLLPLVLDARPPSLKQSTRAKTYESLTDRILQTFDPTQGSLTTWTIRLTRRDRTLNIFLLEHGVYLISDWAILNDTKPQQLERILSDFYHLTPFEISAASQLLGCYHAVYRRDRLRQNNARTRCYEPTSEQLTRIQACLQMEQARSDVGEVQDSVESPARLLARLQTLASQLRQYRIYRRGGKPPVESIDAPHHQLGTVTQLAAPSPDTTTQEQDDFLDQFRAQIQQSLDDVIDTVVSARVGQLKPRKKGQSYLTGLHLFHCCGQSMGAMAEVLGLKAQYQVSRLLNLKTLRMDIRQKLLQQLCDRVLTQAQQYVSLSRLKTLDAQLELILTEQVDEIFSEAAAEASAHSSGPFKSLYAHRLCCYLKRRL